MRMRLPFFGTNTRIYLDHASSTPVDSRVLGIMARVARRYFANPSALHASGIAARGILDSARSSVARLLGAHADEIVFTSGGTESDAIAVMGVIETARRARPGRSIHVVASAIEHSAVREALARARREGVLVDEIPPGPDGIIDPRAVASALSADTVLVAVMHANNEIGTIQPVREIAKELRGFKKRILGDQSSPYPLLHVDAAQSMQYIGIDVSSFGADIVTWNGSKLYGPKGAGALFIRRGTPIVRTMEGGDQERGLRPGTENLPAIAGLAEAMRIAHRMRDREAARTASLRDYAFAELDRRFPGIRINGDRLARLPNNINISVPRMDSELLVIELDARGIEVSAKSACKSHDPDASYVLKAIDPARPEGEGSVRVSLGRSTSARDIGRFLEALASILAKYRIDAGKTH